MRIDDIGYHHKHKVTFHINRPKGAGNWLFLLMKTPSIFILNDNETIVRENSFIIFTPDYPQNYKANGKEYIDDWIHFEPGETEQNLINQLEIPLNVPTYIGNVSALSHIIKHMSFEYYSTHQNRNHIVDLYFQMLLYKLQEQIHAPYSDMLLDNSFYIDQLLWVRASVFRWPEQNWSIDVFAKELRLSVSHFQHLYTGTFGTTILQDITNGRMQRARTLLETTDLNIEEIAEKCGYESVSYFIRLFRKSTGTTPLQYRKSISS